MSLYLFKIVSESLVKEFKDLSRLVGFTLKFHLLVIKLLNIAWIGKLEEILELVDVACIWLEELAELLKVIVINMNEVGT